MGEESVVADANVMGGADGIAKSLNAAIGECQAELTIAPAAKDSDCQALGYGLIDAHRSVEGNHDGTLGQLEAVEGTVFVIKIVEEGLGAELGIEFEGDEFGGGPGGAVAVHVLTHPRQKRGEISGF